MQPRANAMQSLAFQRCSNHAEREAVARCPECSRFFCRECITEHEDRVVCAACLKKIARVPLTRRPGFATAIRVGQLAVGILVVWFFFFMMGEKLLSIPTSFHERTLWHGYWMDEK